MLPKRTRRVLLLASLVGFGLGSSSTAFADEHISGYITGLGTDSTFLIQTDDSRNLVVVPNEFTKVEQNGRWYRATKETWSTLMPGLRVKVKGEYLSNDRFDAEKVSYSKSNMKVARAVQSGIAPTERKLAATDQRLAATDQRLAATVVAVEATNTRITNLDTYDVIETVTVYFPNAKASIAPRYKTQLLELAAKASSVPSYIVEVKGFASAVGSEALNQRLSRERADAVTAFLQQSGVPPTRVVPPAAMGVSYQVASNRTAEGQAANRRAVVTLKQNRGIANRPSLEEAQLQTQTHDIP